MASEQVQNTAEQPTITVKIDDSALLVPQYEIKLVKNANPTSAVPSTN
jgi:hypothetical protein